MNRLIALRIERTEKLIAESKWLLQESKEVTAKSRQITNHNRREIDSAKIQPSSTLHT